MGRTKKNKKSKRQNRENPDSSESKTAAHNTTNTSKPEFDVKTGTECNQRSTDGIKRSGQSLQTLLEWTLANEIENRSVDVGADCSQRKESDIIDEEINGTMNLFLQAMWINKCVPETGSKAKARNISYTPHGRKLNPAVESCQYLYKYANNHSTKWIDNFSRIEKQKKYLQKLSNITFPAVVSRQLTAEAKAEALESIRILEALEKDSDVQVTTETGNVEDNKIVTYLEKRKTMKALTNDGEISDDDIKNTSHIPQKENKGAGGSSNDISEAEKSPSNIKMEYDDEALTKTKDTIEGMAEAKGGPEIMQTNEAVSIILKQNKAWKYSSQKLQSIFKEFLALQGLESDAEKHRSLKPLLNLLKEWFDQFTIVNEETENAESVKDANASKELTNEANDIIMKLENGEGNEKGKYVDASTDSNQVAIKSPQIITENKKKGRKGKEDSDTTKINIQNVRSNKETMKLVHGSENCMGIEYIAEERHSNNDDKIIYPIKAKIKSKCSIKEYLTLKKSKFYEQAKKYGDILSDLKPINEQQDSFSSEKGLRTVKKTESYSENKFKTDLEGEAIKEILSTQLEDSNETIVQMNECNIINFKFDTYRNRCIYSLDNKFYFPLNNKQPLTFRFRDEDIQVCYTGEKMFVSTKNREFDFYIRNLVPVYSTDEVTQTDQ